MLVESIISNKSEVLERGAIYIFNSYTTSGIENKNYQRITASVRTKAFGSAIQGGFDVDQNGYKDIAVADFMTDQIFLYSTKSTIRVRAQLDSLKKYPIGGLPGNRKYFNCESTSSSSSTGEYEDNCWKVCISFDGDESDRKTEKLNFRIQSSLDIKQGHQAQKRLKLKENSEFEITISNVIRGQEKCKIKKLDYTEKDEKQKSVFVLTQISLKNEKSRQVIIDPNSQIKIETEIKLFKNCGQGDKCNATLTRDSSQLRPAVLLFESPRSKSLPKVKGFMHGNEKQVNLIINVTVDGDPSYNTQLYLDIPESAKFRNISSIGINKNSHRIPRGACKLQTDGIGRNRNRSELICMLGHPLPQNTHHFNISLTVSPTGKVKEENFRWIINNTNDGGNDSSSSVHGTVNLPIRIEPDLMLTAAESKWEDCNLTVGNVPTKNNVPFSFDQNFSIVNNGSIDIEEAVVIFEIPTHARTQPVTQVLNYISVTGTADHSVKGTSDTIQLTCKSISKYQSPNTKHSKIHHFNNKTLHEDRRGNINYVSIV